MCDTAIDFILVLDDSYSIERFSFRRRKKAVVDGFVVGQEAARFAVVMFGAGARIESGVFCQQQHDQVRHSHAGWQHVWDQLAIGLRKAQEEFEGVGGSGSEGARPGAARVAILLSVE